MTDEELALLEVRPRTWFTAVKHFFGFAKPGDTMNDGSIFIGWWHTPYGSGGEVVSREHYLAALQRHTNRLL